MKQVNVAIIGAGSQGKIHMRNCLVNPSINLVGVADVSRKALEYATKIGVKKVYTNYEDLLKEPNVDAIIITLPNFLHLESVVKTAEAKKHILLEKPLAGNVKDGEEMLLAARKNDVKLMLAYNWRFDPELNELRQSVESGFFGEVAIAEVSFIAPGPFVSRGDMMGPKPVPSWWFNKELVGGGALLDLGSHIINLLGWYFGEVKNARSYLGYKFNMDVEDTATCLLEFKNGPLAVVNAGWFSKNLSRSIHIFGTAKSDSMDIAPQTKRGIILGDIKKKIGMQEKTTYTAELDHFVKCISNDIPPSPTGEEGLTDLRVINMAYSNVLNTP